MRHRLIVSAGTRLTLWVCIASGLLLGGCAGAPHTDGEDPLGEVVVRAFMLSPGDEIAVSVYKHDELDASILVPPDGIVFFPMVGEIDTTAMTLSDLRAVIADGLSRDHEQHVQPGDEITISVFMHEEFDRRLIVPSDGRLFFPHVGEIESEAMTLSGIRAMITEGLSSYVADPQVMIDIVELNNPARIADPQVTIEVVSLRGQRAYVLGEVSRPGAYAVNGLSTLAEIVALAGGLTEDANGKSLLVARSRGVGNPRDLALYSMDDHLESGDPTQNPVIQAGDIIYAPRSFIANVDRFFERLARIVSPVVDIETGIWLGQNIDAGPVGRANP